MSESYKGHKAGSRKGKVHADFDENGLNSAVEYGTSLGLAEGTIRSWCKAWEKGGSPPVKSERVRLTESQSPPLQPGRAKVFDTRTPEQGYGIIVNRGVEVSEVRWDNGDREYVTNDFLKAQPQRESKRA